MSFFDRVASAMTGKKAPGAPDLRRLVEAANGEVEAAERRLSDLKARRAEVIATGGDAGRIELRAAITTAEADVEDAREALTLLETRLAEKLAADEQAKRLREYERAQKLRDDVADEVRRRYPEFAAGLVGLVAKIAEADAAIQEANRKLPRDFGELSSVEFHSRIGGYRPSHTVADEIVDLWVREGGNEPADDSLQGRVEDAGNGRGLVRERIVVTVPPDPQRGSGGGRVTEERVLHFERRSFRRIEVILGEPGVLPDRLCQLSLPPLEGGAVPFWVPLEPWTSPASISRQLAELEGARSETPPLPEPRRRVTFTAVDDKAVEGEDRAA